MEEAATWPELVTLMRQEPRPPLRAVVVEKHPAYEQTPAVDRRVSVLHDGDALWFVQEGQDWRLARGTEAVFYEKGKVEGFRGVGVAFDTGIMALFHGRLMSSLPDATGTITGTKEVAGRPCWLVDTNGLRDDGTRTLIRLAIDKSTGFVLEITRPDLPEALLVVESIEIGVAQLPTEPNSPPWQPFGPEDFPEEPPPSAPGQPRPVAISPGMSDVELRRALFGDDQTD